MSYGLFQKYYIEEYFPENEITRVELFPKAYFTYLLTFYCKRWVQIDKSFGLMQCIDLLSERFLNSLYHDIIKLHGRPKEDISFKNMNISLEPNK